EIFAAGAVFPSLGNIHRHPALAIEPEFSPAVVAGDLAGVLGGRNADAHLESRGDLLGACHGDEQRMEVAAVAALVVANPFHVTASPAGAALVVLQNGDHVIVEGASALQFAVASSSLLRGQAG